MQFSTNRICEDVSATQNARSVQSMSDVKPVRNPSRIEDDGKLGARRSLDAATSRALVLVSLSESCCFLKQLHAPVFFALQPRRVESGRVGDKVTVASTNHFPVGLIHHEIQRINVARRRDSFGDVKQMAWR